MNYMELQTGTADTVNAVSRSCRKTLALGCSVNALREAPDIELIARVAARDDRALNVLHQRYQPRLKRFLFKYLRNEELVGEAINDAFLVVWQKAIEFDRTRSSFSTWFLGIALRTALRQRARAARYNSANDSSEEAGLVGDIDTAADPAVIVQNWATIEALSAAVTTLAPLQRKVVHLMFVEGRSYKQIALLLRCPENTIKTRMFHARRALAKKLASVASWTR